MRSAFSLLLLPAEDGFTTFCLQLGHVKNQRQRTPANRKCLRCIVASLIFLVSLIWLMSFMFMPYAPSIQYDLLKVSNRLSSLRFPTLRWLKNCLWNSRLQCSDCVLSNPSCPEESQSYIPDVSFCRASDAFTLTRSRRCMVTLAIGATKPNICGIRICLCFVVGNEHIPMVLFKVGQLAKAIRSDGSIVNHRVMDWTYYVQ